MNTCLRNRGGFLVLAILAAVLLSAAGCATPGGGAAGSRLPSEQETFAVQTVNAMTDALSNGDVPRFMGKISPGYYRGYTRLEKILRDGLAARPGRRVSAEVLEITVDDPKIHVRVRWKATWSSAPGADAGEGTLVFMKGAGFKLIDYSGNALFGI